MTTIYTLVIWGVLSGTFPSKRSCQDMGQYLKTVDPKVEYTCKFTRGRISWQQLR